MRTTADVGNAALTLSSRSSTASEAEDRPSGDADDVIAAGEPPHKMVKLDPAVDFWVSWDARQKQNQGTRHKSSLSVEVETEVKKYLSEPCQP